MERRAPTTLLALAVIAGLAVGSGAVPLGDGARNVSDHGQWEGARVANASSHNRMCNATDLSRRSHCRNTTSSIRTHLSAVNHTDVVVRRPGRNDTDGNSNHTDSDSAWQGGGEYTHGFVEGDNVTAHQLDKAGTVNRTGASWDSNLDVANDTDLWNSLPADNSTGVIGANRVSRQLSDAGMDVNDTAAACPELVNRTLWGGRDPVLVEKLKAPAQFVVIHHTYIPGACTESSDCRAKMRQMQESHMSKRWNDIGYNFLIGGDDKVYAGRGWGVVGAHSPKYNFFSVGISFIGDYRKSVPPASMLELARSLIACGVARGSVQPDYRLVGHRQVRNTECPGDALFAEIQTWPHWEDYTDIVPRENVTANKQ